MCEKMGRFISASFRGGNQFIGRSPHADCKGAAAGLHRNTRSRLVEKFAVLLTRLSLIAAFISTTAVAAPKVVIAPTPPQPVEQKVTVKRGGRVDIPLRIYGTRAQTLAWVIRQQPAHGKLSAIRATAPETAVVTYRPPTDLRIVSDHFTFSARSNEGVSAPADVTITIADDPPQLSVPAEVNFGALLIGTSVTKLLEFTNGGGGFAEGAIEVDAPWRLEGARRYKLAAGERHIAKIVFAPERAGKFESEVRFPSQPDRAVSIVGIGEAALAVTPAELTLAQDAGQPLRAGSFELRNNTDAALDVTVAASPRLIVAATLHVPPHSATAASVQTAEKDGAPLDETIRFTAGTLSALLPVKANALPALIRARPSSVTFRRIGVGATARERVVFENLGGMESKVALAIGAPFSIEENTFVLAPNAEKEITVTLAATSAGSAQAVLKATLDRGGFDIPIEAGVSSISEPASAPRRPAPQPVARRESVEPESAPAFVSSGQFAATIVSAGEHSATFQWPGAIPAGAKLRCLLRTLTPDENGELVSTFHEFPTCSFTRRDDTNLATVEKLEPGNTYHFRIEAVTGDGATPLTFAQVRTPAPPPRATIFSLTRILIALALLAAGASIWQRVRSRGL